MFREQHGALSAHETISYEHCLQDAGTHHSRMLALERDRGADDELMTLRNQQEAKHAIISSQADTLNIGLLTSWWDPEANHALLVCLSALGL